MEQGQQFTNVPKLPDPVHQSLGEEISSILGYASRAITGVPGANIYKLILGDKPRTWNGTTMYDPKASTKDWAKDAAITAATLYGGKGGVGKAEGAAAKSASKASAVKPKVTGKKPTAEEPVTPAKAKEETTPAKSKEEAPKTTKEKLTGLGKKAAVGGAVAAASVLGKDLAKGDEPWKASGVV